LKNHARILDANTDISFPILRETGNKHEGICIVILDFWKYHSLIEYFRLLKELEEL